MAEEAVDSSDDNKWYSQPIFNPFWSHYNDCNKWMEQMGHKVVRFGGDLVDTDAQTSPQFDAHPRTSGGQSADYRMDALEAIHKNECDYNETEEALVFENIEDEDISDEYLEFVLKTRRHQSERKKWKEKRLRDNSRVEYIDISRLDSFSRKSVAPKRGGKWGHKRGVVDGTDTSGKSAQELRREKMYELYGDDCNAIQGMETAIQLNFDRLCDVNQPKFWPIMSIKMTPIPQ